MREYVFNFWFWWYAVQIPLWGRSLLTRTSFFLNYTNTLPMAKNLLVPLFQDNSGIGKVISLPIRLVWVWWGGMLSMLLVLPYLLAWVVAGILPVLTIIVLISGLGRIL